ncbi:hypothetical protein, unknown function [Leishmania tarentolae]|uniref:Uncharacterized protein n=1 Tax=Leishmania tarentolae TaxID=5689 RepID=A0A640K8V0_LEITA|nr:hypothetical protein, unknown function [Leishmania tarentolae]
MVRSSAGGHTRLRTLSYTCLLIYLRTHSTSSSSSLSSRPLCMLCSDACESASGQPLGPPDPSSSNVRHRGSHCTRRSGGQMRSRCGHEWIQHTRLYPAPSPLQVCFSFISSLLPLLYSLLMGDSAVCVCVCVCVAGGPHIKPTHTRPPSRATAAMAWRSILRPPLFRLSLSLSCSFSFHPCALLRLLPRTPPSTMSKCDLAKDAQVPVHATVLRFGDDVDDAKYPEAALVVDGVAVPAQVEVDVYTGRDGDHENAPRQAQAPQHDFTTGILDCHSCAVCLDACLCTYCIASAHHNFLVNRTEGVYFPICCGLLCVDVGLSSVSSYLPSSLCFHTYFMRRVIRNRYNLHPVDPSADSDEHANGSGLDCSTQSLLDLATVWLCLPCAVAQHQREIMRQGDWCGGVLSNRCSIQAPARVYTL